MKRLAVFSDSHGLEDRLRQAALHALSRGPLDAAVFLGDGLSEWERVSRELLLSRPGLRLYAVRGNNDYGWEAPDSQVVSLGRAKLLLCHGHRFHVKSGVYALEMEAVSREVQGALFGHTHAGYLDEAYGILFLNPGAACNYGGDSPVYGEVVEEEGILRGRIFRGDEL